MLSLVSADLIAKYTFDDTLNDELSTYDLTGQGSYSYSTDVSTLYGGKSFYSANGVNIGAYNSDLKWTGGDISFNIMFKNGETATQKVFNIGNSYSAYNYSFLFQADDSFMDIAIRNPDLSYGGVRWSGLSMSITEYHHVIGTFDSTTQTATIYWNNITTNSSAMLTNPAAYDYVDGMAIGSDTYLLDLVNIDQLEFYDHVLTSDEIISIFDTGSVGVPHNYSVTTSQSPDNLTTDTIGQLYINATISDNVGNLTDGNATIDFQVISKANKCGYISQYEGDVCYTLNDTYTMNQNNFSLYTYDIDETLFIPAIYPFGQYQEWLEDQIKSDRQIVSGKSVKYNINNMTTNQSQRVYVEFNAVPYSTLITDYALRVIYCNSSYVDGNVLSELDGNCELLEIISPSDEPDHCHTINACHYVKQLPSNIVWTETGSFIFTNLGSGTTDSWYLRYVENATYESGTTVFDYSTNYGGSWTSSNRLFDVHVHQFAPNDGIVYNITYNDNESNTAYSNTVTDYFDFFNNPPSPVIIYHPTTDQVITINSTGVDVVFNWSNATDEEGDAITYRVGLTNNGVESITYLSSYSNETNITYTFDSDVWSNDEYKTYVFANDQNSISTSTMVGRFTLCVNNWQPVEGLCIDGIQNVTYSDLNSCPDQYEQPSSYQQNCIIQTGNSDITLIILWSLFGLLAIYFISKGHMSGWFFLGLIVMLFSFTTLQEITDEQVLYLVGYVLSVILMAFALMNNTLNNK